MPAHANGQVGGHQLDTGGVGYGELPQPLVVTPQPAGGGQRQPLLQRLAVPVKVAQGPGQGVIVTNPPYIREDDPHMPALRHEPRQALTSGEDGLDDIRTICTQAPAKLLPGGWLLIEHGWDQGTAVAALLQNSGFTQVQHRHDLAGIARCTGGQMPTAHGQGQTVK